MEASSLPIPLYVKLPYGELRQIGCIEAEVGLDVEQAIAVVVRLLGGA